MSIGYLLEAAPKSGALIGRQQRTKRLPSNNLFQRHLMIPPLSEVLKDPFPDIPLWDDSTSTHRNPNADERMRILDKLREKGPKVAAFTVAFPWMLIEIDMDTDLPPFRSTPFLICGLVAVFIHEGPGGSWIFWGKGGGTFATSPRIRNTGSASTSHSLI
jgi:hypothetical protein